MKKIIGVVFCISLCAAIGAVVPGFSVSEELVQDTTCLECHDSAALHRGSGHIDCFACHEGVTAKGTVSPSSCLACHPRPLLDATSCDLIEFHENHPDYEPTGESCLDCHDCSGGSTTTTMPTTTTSTEEGPCPSIEIYGEDSVEVFILRSIRDNVLSQTQEGQEIIKLYYQWSPVITMAIRNDNKLRAELKELIDRILSMSLQQAD
jgi:hypothetical protein